MLSEQLGVNWLVSLMFAIATLVMSGDAARADSASLSNGCGCGSQLPAASWAVTQPGAAVTQPGAATTQPGAATTRPFWMRPTPTYNSSWKQVSVTNYQAQVINDPLSGVAVRTIQPCNTYESQLRRTASCSLWQRLVNWWNSRCCCIGSRTISTATATCPPTGEWVVATPEPAASPYYSPPTSGRLVPVPSGVLPSSPVPADRRPALDPVPRRPRDEGSASRLLPDDREVFVRQLDGPAASIELGPPLVAPRSRDEEVFESELERNRPMRDAELDDRTTDAGQASAELVPVNWTVPTPSYERQLPTDEVWDDSGWKSVR